MNKFYRDVTLSLGVASAVTSCANVAKQSDNLNILFIMTDDHTAQMMSCYDKRFVETPNLDRIAADGVLFTNSFVANSISGPSRACMLTGKHSHANGFTDNTTSRFDGSQQTYPKLLQKNGYQTAMIGKWHLHTTPTGFDHWAVVPDQGDYYNPEFYTSYRDTIIVEGYLTNLVTDMTIDWLEQVRDKSKPFCMIMSHKAVHRNWMPETKYLELYEDKIFDMPTTFWDTYEGRHAAATQEMSIEHDMDILYDLKLYDKDDTTSPLKDFFEKGYLRMNNKQREAWDKFYNSVADDFKAQNLSGRQLAEWKYQRYMRDYAKTLRSLDDSVGEILDYLEKSGLNDNTLVIYTSDQGFYMGEHGWFDKRFMYEQSLNTPLVMRLPKGFNRRGEITELVQNIDYAPTILDIANCQIPEDMQGRSLLPILRGETTEWRKGIYYHFYEYPAEHMVKRHYGVRTERYKLIRFYYDIETWELYDLQNDPEELHNIYSKIENQGIIKELKMELERLQKEYNVPNDLIHN
ncbi:MAG: sulfatase [Rikenellaceae bacterium]